MTNIELVKSELAVRNVNLPDRIKLAQLQADDVYEAASAGRILLAYEVGSGKTLVSTCAAVLLGGKVTVTMPPILLDEWKIWLNECGITDVEIYRGPKRKPEQLNAKWVLVSHAIFRDDITAFVKARGRNTLIVDECFVSGTPVIAASGESMPIESFREGDFVLTSAGPRPILKIFKGLTLQLIELELSNGTKLTCTPNHPIFTDLGWLAAKDCAGRRLLHSSHLSDVRLGVQAASELANLRSEAWKPDRYDLLQTLRNETEGHTLPGEVRSSRNEAAWTNCYRPERPGCAQNSAHGRASETPFGSCESEGTNANSSWRQWDWTNRSGKSNLRYSGRAGIYLESGGFSGGETGRVSDQLQAGFWPPGTEGGLGGGRGIAQGSRTQTSRSEENGEVGELRVESVSSRELENPEPVWNFEVGGCPHYFAGGILVHNCHAAKNPRSVLFKAINTFVGADGNLIMCTATPTSKPPDTYAYMRLKTPEIYRSYGHWSNLHIVDVDPFGQPTGYANLEMLAQNFAIKTIKRTKVDIFGPQIEPRVYPVRYALSAKHTKLYEKLVNEQLLLLPGGDKIDATTAQRLYHALQQIVINFAKFSGKPEDQSASLELLEETLSEVDPMTPGNSKLTVWTYYQSSSEVVYDYLVKKFGQAAVCIAYGKSNSREAVRRIMHDDATRIMVAQASSVGVGLNLQHVCWEMLFLEYSTVPAQTRQALGRVDRVGQIHQANCRIGVALGTVQVNLLNRLLSNDDLVSQVEMTPTRLRDMLLGRT